MAGRARFIVGDEVTDGENVGVIKLSYPRAADGKQWPIAHVTTGPEAGRRLWPTGWRALIDWSPTGWNLRRCAECERDFKQPSDGTRRTWCRTCARAHDEADARETRDRRHEGIRSIKAYAHGARTVLSEPGPAPSTPKAKHPVDCVCDECGPF